MRIEISESKDMVPCTEISLFLNDGSLLANETYIGTGVTKNPYSLRRYALATLHRSEIVLGNELDDLARTFQSTADVVEDDVYRIIDLLNYSMEDFIKGNVTPMYEAVSIAN